MTFDSKTEFEEPFNRTEAGQIGMSIAALRGVEGSDEAAGGRLR